VTRNDQALHVLSLTYLPRVLEVNTPAGQADPPTSGLNALVNPTVSHFTTIQAALNAADTTAARLTGTPLVVVYPNTRPTPFPNPHRAYYENVIVRSRVKLQGTGPGGAQGSSYVAGSEINGFGFDPDGTTGANWYALLASLTHAGIPEVADAAVVTVVPPGTGGGAFSGTTATSRASIDGFSITGGVEQNAGTNADAVNGGAVSTPFGAPGARVTQGGGIYVHAGAQGLQISDNVLVGNSGAYGGAIRVGTPYADVDNANDNLRIARNLIRDNGGMNLAGGVALFSGADGYEVDHNVVCGNFSAEYGGGISHYGLSGGVNSIHDNAIYYNESYDEGGGVMIAGQLPANPIGLYFG
jgi:hypothetical protein